MTFQVNKQPYSGKIGQTIIGTGDRAVTLGGADAYPFHFFEGSLRNPPKIGMEIWDCDPSEDWPAALVAPFEDVIASPEAWAGKCVEVYGADFMVVHLKSTDPNGMDRGGDEAAASVKRVVEAVKVPVIAWGTSNHARDEEALKRIAELCQGRNVGLSPVEEANYKGIGAAALAYDQTIVASSPIDVNLAKQLNIMLGNLGLPAGRVIIDPTTGALGYGLEYTYSVMERIRMAALTQEDEKLQIPMICNVGREVWKSKEARQSMESAPNLGDPERRGILMEATAAVTYILAGADAVVLIHPEAVRLVRDFIHHMISGGSMAHVRSVSKRMKEQAPAPVITKTKKKAAGEPVEKTKAEHKATGSLDGLKQKRPAEKTGAFRGSDPVQRADTGEPESMVDRLTRHLARMHRRF